MTVSEHVWIGGGGLRDGGVVGSYQPGVYVPLKALFLVEFFSHSKSIETINLQGLAKFDPRGMNGTIYVEDH